jgi:hypothetical protein
VIDRAELEPFLVDLSLDGPIEPFHVLADFLQSKGELWGELIAIQCASRELMELHASNLWDEQERLKTRIGREINPFFREVGVAVIFDRGFIKSVLFHEPFYDLGKRLAALFELPSGRLVTEMSFRNCFLDDASGGQLAKVPQLRRMKHLDLRGNRFQPDTIRDLYTAFPGALVDGQFVAARSPYPTVDPTLSQSSEPEPEPEPAEPPHWTNDYGDKR